MNAQLLSIGIGAIVGICSGMFGIGGGVILVPILILGFKYAPQNAAGISLVALLLPVGALGAYKYYTSGFLTPADIKMGLIIAIGIFFGAYVGAYIASHLPKEVMSKVFGVFLMGISIKLLLGK